jgi:hypothetical protein
MATRYKILAQAAPAATTNTDLYTVPAGKDAIVSTIVVANRSTATTYRIWAIPSGASLANEHYLAYDVAVGDGDSTTITLGITLTAGDVIGVRGTSANLSFSVFGSEIDF